jgi:diketogulonate reductase-like aldo/keto reductase
MSQEISDQLKIAEQALGNALRLIAEIPSKEMTDTTRNWVNRVRTVKQDAANLKRMGLVIDLLYKRKRRFK